MKRQVLNYVNEVAAKSHSEAELTTADVAQDHDDLFSFMNSAGKQAAEKCPVAKKVEEFMKSKSTCLLSLNKYTQVARAFVKANSTAQQCSCVTPFQDCWNDPEPEAMQDIGQTF